MKYIIKEMKELSLVDSKTWGNKAAYLSDARKKGISVPDGFCIVLKGTYLDKDNSGFIQELGMHFQSLKERTGALHYIVRSSAQYEDSENHIFPGIYESKRNVSDLEELLKAVELCYNSFRAKIADLYIKSLEVKADGQEYYCVMVQEQIEPEYSGVAFTKVPIPGYYGMDSYLVEMVQGHCQDMLLGKKTGNAYIIERQQGSFQSKQLSFISSVCKDIRQKILGKLGEIVDIIVKLYGQNLDIEWGYSRGKILIFQIRPVHNRKENLSEEVSSLNSMGLKAEAMKEFYSLGLFQKKLLILEPGKELKEVKQCLQEAEYLNGPITIRYSWNRELGLPRYFAINREDAFNFIQRTYNQEWAIIIHESISVQNSYELYVDEDKSILEHVPGMWEADNKVDTDTWIYHKRKVTAFAAGCMRRAKYEDVVSQEYHMVNPYTEDEIKEIAKEVYPYIQTVCQNWSVKGGTNFHFVRDKEKKFFFLNHRKISKIREWEEEKENLTVVETMEDLLKWQGGSILLKINLKRGEEVLLKEYVPFLKKVEDRIYVQFGILSHPSILLREMGIEVFPEYTLHKKIVFEI